MPSSTVNSTVRQSPGGLFTSHFGFSCAWETSDQSKRDVRSSICLFFIFINYSFCNVVDRSIMPPACAALACSTRAQAGGVTLRCSLVKVIKNDWRCVDLLVFSVQFAACLVEDFFAVKILI